MLTISISNDCVVLPCMTISVCEKSMSVKFPQLILVPLKFMTHAFKSCLKVTIFLGHQRLLRNKIYPFIFRRALRPLLGQSNHNFIFYILDPSARKVSHMLLYCIHNVRCILLRYLIVWTSWQLAGWLVTCDILMLRQPL